MEILIEQTDEQTYPGRASIIWRAVEKNVRRLQERIYRATEDIGIQSLSRLPGNWHGRFLGGGGLVTVPCYPTFLKVGSPAMILVIAGTFANP